jgi:hypothetical protein
MDNVTPTDNLTAAIFDHQAAAYGTLTRGETGS